MNGHHISSHFLSPLDLGLPDFMLLTVPLWSVLYDVHIMMNLREDI